ncbi:MAG: putative addiction module antidote protein [Campylobacteraceae bacterium]|nr:putative addiction module antidote protein [Campylobacteraceae bacterium]
MKETEIVITREDAKLIPFEANVPECLTDEKTIERYLNYVLSDGDETDFKRALGHIAKARGVTKTSKETGISRDSLYKTIIDGTTKDTRFSTIQKLLDSFGFRLKVEHKTA